MIGATEWTMATLKEHEELMIAKLEEKLIVRILAERDLANHREQASKAAVEAAMTSAKEAVGKAEIKSELAIKGLEDKITMLAKSDDERKGNRNGLSAGWAAAAGVVSLAVLAVSIFLMFRH